MNIYMYNMWFGDCFQIEDGRDNLFIDLSFVRYYKQEEYFNEYIRNVTKCNSCEKI